MKNSKWVTVLAVVALISSASYAAAVKCKPVCTVGTDGKVHCTVTCS